MALTFATVAEGATDHAVLQNILLGVFKEIGLESGDISPVQPQLDQTGRQLPEVQGGWQQVLRWLEDKRYHDAFQFNEHVVVQIDTDVCEEAGLDIPKVIGGIARPVDDLVSAVKAKLEAIIGPDDLLTYAGRFHFAIAVHEIECWLLPLWGRSREIAGVHGCKQRVDSGLQRGNLPGLRKDDVRTYASASADFRKRKQLDEASENQASLAIFLASLERLRE